MSSIVQRHPSVSYQSPHLDSRSPFSSSSPKQHYFHHDRSPQGQQGSLVRAPSVPRSYDPTRTFPIRTSQPPPQTRISGSTHPRSSFVPPPHVTDHEHHLRRKTPNGTIDAGYDGTPHQLALGPPPPKHLMMPPASHTRQDDYHSSQHAAGPTSTTWSYPNGNSPFMKPERNGLTNLNSNTFPFDRGRPPNNFENAGIPFGMGAMDCAPNGGLTTPYFPYNNGVRVPTALQPMYQQPPGPAVFDNGGLLPPPAWLGPSMHNYHPHVHPGAREYLRPYPPPQFQFNPMDGMGTLGPAFPGSVPPVPYDMNGPGAHGSGFQVPSHKLESLSLDTAQLPNSIHSHDVSPAMFRDRALSNAHRAYIELIAKSQHTGNGPHNGPLGPNSKISSRVTIFPKPPKSSLAKRIRHPLNPAQSMNDGFLGPSMNFSGSDTNPPFYTLFGGADQHPPARGHAPIDPETSARAAVDMLHSLCEQSGWEWIDGMLLGGCLYYGLGDFEKAMDWFNSVIQLHSNHVEAISNIAACHYCLQRFHEAERQWTKAVELRPSYLEAVEHLVGLLCATNKGRQAVEIITFVQRSTRLPDRHDTWGSRMEHQLKLNDTSPGFGSSGYSVPGSENGRVITLIHAKGNLLYALKDIHRASKAFEEAVLISAGLKFNGIQSLIQRIQTVLSPPSTHIGPGGNALQVAYPGPLLLPPEKAQRTSYLVFEGEPPGLRYVSDKRAAISTTSNSLLSLAKIFQDAMSSGASIPRVLPHACGMGDILALYYLSLSLSQSPSTANNVGILLASIQQSGPVAHGTVIPSATLPPGIIPGSGLALALAYYHYGLTLDPKHVHLHTNLGSLLKDVGLLDAAIQMYERAVNCDDKFDIALTNLANAVKDRGKTNEAIGYYKRAVESNPDFAEAVCGLSTALNSVCDWRGRGGVFLQGGIYDRWHVDDNGMVQDVQIGRKGSGLMKRVVDIVAKQLADASHWGIGTLQDSVIHMLGQQLATLTTWKGDSSYLVRELRKWSGRPWEGSRLLRLVERSTKVAMHRWYQDKYGHGRASNQGYRRVKLPTSLAVPNAPTVLPFHTFTCPLSAKEIRMISQRNAARISCSTLRSPWLPDTVFEPPPPPRPHLNIGYVSSDFNNHPLAHLMQSVFGFHNPSRAKAFCYATTPSDRSLHRQQIEREAPVFRDVSSWSAERLVHQIVKDEIHILVNLNGYTRGARNEIFAARPAPIQMSFMGFAGTLGAEWCDYILADGTAIPDSTLRPARSNLSLEDVFSDEEHNDEEHWMYSENIIFCRDSFFCCDHAQSSDAEERTVTWEDEQRRRWKMRKQLFPDLPDDTIILGNFNQLYKIDPSTFRTWLRILSNVPRAILWLLRFPELGEANLRRTAREWASEDVANRLYFTDVAPKQHHISRARVCDLFLDTPECNAHTTAADVLWSSTPLVTLPRYPYKMCSRMAASILRGALPKDAPGDQAASELIAEDDEDYETLATRLAGGLTYKPSTAGFCEGSGRLADIRKLLFDAKWTCGLFNTRRWVTDLENAYDEAWRRWVAGEGGDIYL